jgi:hypothetical protein
MQPQTIGVLSITRVTLILSRRLRVDVSSVAGFTRMRGIPQSNTATMADLGAYITVPTHLSIGISHPRPGLTISVLV